jgi:hypothetical protein
MPTPVTSPSQTDFMVLTMFINKGNQGWSEKHVINAVSGTPPVPTYATAAPLALNIINNRANILALGAMIVWARLTLKSNPRLSVPALPGPVFAGRVDGETTVESTNKVEDCLEFRADDMAGIHSTRAIRCLRDSWIADTNAGITVPAVLPTLASVARAVQVSGFLLPVDALYNYLLAVMQNSVLLKKNPVSGPAGWRSVNIVNWTYRGTGERKTGRPFNVSRGRAASRV